METVNLSGPAGNSPAGNTKTDTQASPAAANATFSRPYSPSKEEIQEWYIIGLVQQMVERGQTIDVFPQEGSERLALQTFIDHAYSSKGGSVLDIKEIEYTEGGKKLRKNVYYVSTSGQKLFKGLQAACYELNTIFDGLTYINVNGRNAKERIALARYGDFFFEREKDEFDASGNHLLVFKKDEAGKRIPRDRDDVRAEWDSYIADESKQWRDWRTIAAVKKGISPGKMVFMNMLNAGEFKAFDFMKSGVDAWIGEFFKSVTETANGQIWPENRFESTEHQGYIGLSLDDGTVVTEEVLDSAYRIVAKEAAEAQIQYEKDLAEYEGRADEFNEAIEEAKRRVSQLDREEAALYDDGEDEVIETTTTVTTVEDYDPPLAIGLGVGLAYAYDPFYVSPVWHSIWCTCIYCW